MHFDWWRGGFDVHNAVIPVLVTFQIGCCGTKDVTLATIKENPLQRNGDGFFRSYKQSDI